MIPSQAAFAQDNCGICLISVATGQGRAIFTAQCSHSFHYPCIVNNVQHGNLCCPICGAKWDEDTVPFQVPLPQQPHPFLPTQNPFQRQPHWTFHTSPFQQQPQAPQEPPSYSDDEPLQSTSQTQSFGPQNVTIRTHTESSAISAAESRPQFPVLVSIRAPPLQDSDGHGRTPIDLVTVLDVSSSMAGLNLDLVKRAVKFVIQNLGASDRLSIVTFSTTARRVFPLRRMSVEGRESAIQAVDSLKSEDMTNIVAGLEIGARILEGRRERNPVASIMLLSDGMHNCGGQILDQLPALIRSSDMQHEIPVHTFGFGHYHDANIMHSISDASGGTFSFIESVGEERISFHFVWIGLIFIEVFIFDSILRLFIVFGLFCSCSENP